MLKLADYWLGIRLLYVHLYAAYLNWRIDRLAIQAQSRLRAANDE